MSKITNQSGVPEDDFMREGLIDRLSQYLEAEPKAWHVRYNLGVALLHDGRVDEALDQFSQVLAMAPKHMESLVNVGGIHLSQGEPDKALKAFTKALAVWDVPVVRANLGVAYLQLGHLEDAERHLRQAIEMAPEMPDALTNLSSVLIQTGRMEEAVEACQKALAVRQDFGMAHNNLAVAYLELDERDKAAEHAKLALESDYPVPPGLLSDLGLAPAENS